MKIQALSQADQGALMKSIEGVRHYELLDYSGLPIKTSPTGHDNILCRGAGEAK